MHKKIYKNKYLNSIIVLIKKNKAVVLTSIFLSIIADIFFTSASSDLRIFAVLAISIFSMYIYGLRSKIIFKLCFLLLVIMLIQFIFSGTSAQTEKSAVWFVLFLGLGIIFQWKE